MTPSLAPAELRSNFGVIVNFQDGASEPALRTETDATPLISFTGGFFRQFNGAASLDGSKLAYWHFTSAQRVPAELRVLDVAKPAEQRTVLTLTTEFPEAIVWSSDGNGVLYTVTDMRSGQGVVAEYSALRSIDLVTGAARELGRTPARHWLLGEAWNRAQAFALGREIDGDTGRTIAYYRYGASTAQRMTVDGPLIGMAASVDGLRMVGSFGASETGPIELRVWALDDPTHYSALLPDPAWPVSKGWGFLPASDEIALWRMNATGDLQLLLWQPVTGQKTALTTRDTGTFRPDGSAVISEDGHVFEVATGRTAHIDLPSGAFISTLVRFPTISASPSPSGTVTVDRCGIIDEAFLGDPPSGGFVTIAGVKFLVQGADPARHVSLSDHLVPGTSACARGAGIQISPQVIDLRSGSIAPGP